jgi:hypothetical protein
MQFLSLLKRPCLHLFSRRPIRLRRRAALMRFWAAAGGAHPGVGVAISPMPPNGPVRPWRSSAHEAFPVAVTDRRVTDGRLPARPPGPRGRNSVLRSCPSVAGQGSLYVFGRNTTHQATVRRRWRSPLQSRGPGFHEGFCDGLRGHEYSKHPRQLNSSQSFVCHPMDV